MSPTASADFPGCALREVVAGAWLAVSLTGAAWSAPPHAVSAATPTTAATATRVFLMSGLLEIRKKPPRRSSAQRLKEVLSDQNGDGSSAAARPPPPLFFTTVAVARPRSGPIPSMRSTGFDRLPPPLRSSHD